MELLRRVALRWDVSLTQAAPRRVTFHGIIMVAAEFKRRDVTLSHWAGGSGVGSKPETVQVSRNWAPASGCEAAQSRFGSRAGMSGDGRRRFVRLNFKIDDLRAGQRILGL
jgi:hypothetical protein